MRDEEVIRREMDSAKETAEELDEERPLDALITQAVYKTLCWVAGDGPEDLEEGLLEIKDED